ncbi:hypothetical protein AAG570_003991 [Ranatra chinensis]|uniref:Uncharacterized protein n=1 Tax=Ranatra chinensis TaxID=642074 RepID=A0ABD0Y2I0_9HEMI
MGSKRRNIFYQNKKQETTEIVCKMVRRYQRVRLQHKANCRLQDAYLRKCSQMDMANRCRVVKQEMRRGRVPSRCDCDKRNGLQDQCGSKGFKCPTEVMEDKMREWETREDRRKNEDTPGGEPCCCCRARWHLERHQSGGCEDHMQPKIDLSNYSLVYVPSSWLPTKIDNPVVVDDRNFKRPNELR